MKNIEKMIEELNDECIKKGLNVMIVVENKDVIHSVRNIKDDSRLVELVKTLKNIYDED